MDVAQDDSDKRRVGALGAGDRGFWELILHLFSSAPVVNLLSI